MVLLSEYLDMIRERPGMYIGKETPGTLETFIMGFDSAHVIDYHDVITNELCPGNRGISIFDTFEEAFSTAFEGAEIAEARYFRGFSGDRT